ANVRMDVVITITNRVPLIAAGIRPETFISFCPSNYRRTFARGRGPSLVEILRAIPPLRGVGGRSQTIPLATVQTSPPCGPVEQRCTQTESRSRDTPRTRPHRLGTA